MLDLARRLSKRNEVHIIDAYGKCKQYHQAIADAHLPCHVVMPNAKHRFIGHHGLKRIRRAIMQLPELLRLRARLVGIIRKLKPDAIWVMNEKSLTFVGTCWSLRHIPIAHAIRGWATPDQVSPWLGFLLRNRVAAVMAVSSASAKQLQQVGIPKDRLHTISSTIDMDKVLRESKRPPLERIPGMDRSPRLLMMAARMEHAKGHPAMLRAVARLVQTGLSPVLWIPGQPPVGSDDSYIRLLKLQCKELNIEDNVFFLGWVENMPQLIQASDICLLPSLSEGLPRSVLEAMLLRRPVIATPVGGIPDAITDGVSGHLIPIDDSDEIANRILQLTTDSHHRERIIDAAYDHLQKDFDADQHTRKVEHVFHLMVPSAH